MAVREKSIQENMLLAACLNVDFAVIIFQEEIGIRVQNIQKLYGSVSMLLKNGKKYCPHSKGIEEEAIEKAFMESYRQVCHNNVEITNEFLKTVEEELKDNSLAKDLKKITNQLDKILKKEKDLVELRLNESISMDIYQDKYNEIAISKEKLLAEKRTLEVTLTDEKALKKRLEGFKKLLESNKYLEEFDRAVFESIVDKIIMGELTMKVKLILQ